MRPSAWVCDLDGVIWRGRAVIPGAPEAVARIRSAGERILFVSNNSSVTVEDLAAKLTAMGVPAGPGDVLTSAEAAASLVLSAQPRDGARVLVLGGTGIGEALDAVGVPWADADDSGLATTGLSHVIVGLDRRISYARISAAVSAVLDGAMLIGTNEDPTFPTEEGLRPGGGSMVALIAYASGVTPLFAGKPREASARLTLDRLGVDSGDGLVMVGDQPRTDGFFAQALGARFALVLSGVTSPEDAESVEPTPTWVATDIAALVDLIERE
jgi:HAD superfamily hydrolase (TIGR01450 family)